MENHKMIQYKTEVPMYDFLAMQVYIKINSNEMTGETECFVPDIIKGAYIDEEIRNLRMKGEHFNFRSGREVSGYNTVYMWQIIRHFNLATQEDLEGVPPKSALGKKIEEFELRRHDRTTFLHVPKKYQNIYGFQMYKDGSVRYSPVDISFNYELEYFPKEVVQTIRLRPEDSRMVRKLLRVTNWAERPVLNDEEARLHKIEDAESFLYDIQYPGKIVPGLAERFNAATTIISHFGQKV